MDSIGEKIKVLREKHGLSQTQLGNLVGLSHAQIGMYEKDKSSPDANMIISLAKALKIHPAHFFSSQSILGQSPEVIQIRIESLEYELKEVKKERDELMIKWRETKDDLMEYMKELLNFKRKS